MFPGQVPDPFHSCAEASPYVSFNQTGKPRPPPRPPLLGLTGVGIAHLRLMVGKTVMGGMKVTCWVDEDVGAAVGRPGHTEAGAGDLLPDHPLSSMPTSRKSGSLGLTGWFQAIQFLHGHPRPSP